MNNLKKANDLLPYSKNNIFYYFSKINNENILPINYMKKFFYL